MGQRHETDTALVIAARAGDRDACATLLERHYPLVLALCARMLRDPSLAQDAAQEAAVQALLGLDRLRDPARFGPWLGGIGLNICRRWLQHGGRATALWEALPGEARDARPGPDDLAEADELRGRILDAVDTLPPGQRATVLLVYLDGLSHAEAASALGIATGAVKTRLFKARRTLRRHLTDFMQEGATMAAADTGAWVEFRVKDVRRHPATWPPQVRYTVILHEVGGAGRHSAWGIGPFEAEALAVQLADVQIPRPLVYTLAAHLLAATGGRLRAVRIARVHEQVDYGELIVAGPNGEQVVDARVSDALNLALACRVPIYIAPAFLPDDTDEAARDWQRYEARLYGEDTEGPAELATAVARRMSPPSPPSSPSP